MYLLSILCFPHMFPLSPFRDISHPGGQAHSARHREHHSHSSGPKCDASYELAQHQLIRPDQWPQWSCTQEATLTFTRGTAQETERHRAGK